MKVLLIDDDLALTTVISATLSQNGFDTLTAPDGQSGFEKAKLEKPDFILLDQVLPDIQGNNVLQMLKEDGQTRTIPVAMLSNYSDTQLMQEALNRGAMDYILKYQIEPEGLVLKINDLYKQSQQKPV